METTETNEAITIDDAIESVIAPTEETTETTEEETQATEETTEVEETAESEEVEVEETEESETDEVEDTDEDDDIEDAVQEESSSTITVKVDGKETEVTLDELKQGYSGQKYVQQGMQQAAQQRKEAEAVYEALLNERQQVQQLLAQAQQGGLPQAPTPPSRELFDADPIGYMDEKLKYDEAKATYDNQMAQFQAVSQQQSESEKHAKQTYLRNEMERLKDVIPEFADSNKASKIKDKLIRGGQEHYGYTPDEIGQVMDHRAIQVLHDAMKYRDIMAGKSKAVAKTKKGKPMVKAGAKKVSDSQAKARKRQKAKLNKSGSIDDALGLILNT